MAKEAICGIKEVPEYGKVYTTSDFPTIIWLLCNEMRPVTNVRSPDGRMVLLFENAEKCADLAHKMLFNDDVKLSRALTEIKRVRQILRQE